jgi:hypothetical protein
MNNDPKTRGDPADEFHAEPGVPAPIERERGRLWNDVAYRSEKSVEENYEEAAERNAYSVARLSSAIYGRILEAGGAYKLSSIICLCECSSDVWTGGV